MIIKRTKLKTMLAICLALVTNLLFSQVIDLQTAGLQRWGRINPVPGFNAQAIAIGDFQPNSALHINTNFLPATTLYVPGNVFRTTAPDDIVNRWVMAASDPGSPNTDADRFFIEGRGNGTAQPTESVNIGTALNGYINFYTNRNNPLNNVNPLLPSVMIQNGGGGFVHGQVAMGNQLPDGFDAQARLHLHQVVDQFAQAGPTPGQNFMQFTSRYTIGGDAPIVDFKLV